MRNENKSIGLMALFMICLALPSMAVPTFNNETVNDTSIELENQTWSINVIPDTNETVNGVSLWYDGTEYAATRNETSIFLDDMNTMGSWITDFAPTTGIISVLSPHSEGNASIQFSENGTGSDLNFGIRNTNIKYPFRYIQYNEFCFDLWIDDSSEYSGVVYAGFGTSMGVSTEWDGWLDTFSLNDGWNYNLCFELNATPNWNDGANFGKDVIATQALIRIVTLTAASLQTANLDNLRLIQSDEFDDLVAHWPLGGSDLATDVVNAKNGLVTGPINSTDRNGVIDMAYHFDGTNDEVNMSDQTEFRIDSQFTISLWANRSGDGVNGQGFMVDKAASTATRNYGLWWLPNGTVEFLVYDTDASSSVFAGYDNLVDDIWHHITAVYDGNKITVYVNGSAGESIVIPNALVTGSSDFMLGRRAFVDGSNFFFNGSLDEIRLYDRALTQAEITALAADAPYDQNDNTWTANFTASFITTNDTIQEEKQFHWNASYTNLTLWDDAETLDNWTIHSHGSGPASTGSMQLSTNNTEGTYSVNWNGTAGTETSSVDLNQTGLWDMGDVTRWFIDFKTNFTIVPQLSTFNLELRFYDNAGKYSRYGYRSTLIAETWTTVEIGQYPFTAYNLISQQGGYDRTNVDSVKISVTDSNKNQIPGHKYNFSVDNMWLQKPQTSVSTTFTHTIDTAHVTTGLSVSNALLIEGDPFQVNTTLSLRRNDLGLTRSVDIEFNNTNTTAILVYATAIMEIWQVNLTTPYIETADLPGFSLNITAWLSTTHNPTRLNNNSTEVSLNIVNITDCTTGYPTLNILILNETSLLPINVTLSTAFQTWNAGGLRTISFGETSTNNTTFCIDPNWSSVNANLTAIYSSALTSEREYNQKDMLLSNATQTITLYALDTSKTDTMTFEVIDYRHVKQAEVTIECHRYYPAPLDTHYIVEAPETDTNGRAYPLLELGAFYNFILKQDGEIVYQDINVRLMEKERVFIIGNAIPTYWVYEGTIAGTCSFNNATNYLNCLLSDTENQVEYSQLVVYHQNESGKHLNCTDTTDGTTLHCYLGSNVTDQIFQYYFNVETSDGVLQTLVSGWLDFKEESPYGVMGLIMGFFIILLSGLAGAMIGREIGTLTGAIFGLDLAYLANFLTIGWEAMVSINAVFFIIIYVNARRVE